MPGPVLVFGHGAPLSDPLLAGLPLRDVTHRAATPPPDSRIAPLIEPFMDPFARAFLFGLEGGVFDDAALVLVWRNGPGALHAFRYAAELRRLGLLPDGPPLHLWNRARPGPGAAAFDAAEAARLSDILSPLPRGPALDRDGPLAALDAMQADGRIAGAEAQRRRLSARRQGAAVDVSASAVCEGPRLALAGGPLGNAALQDWVERRGKLVLDLTGPDAPAGDAPALIAARGVTRVFWQVDPHDDLHGWRVPDLRVACASLGVAFVDLGFVPPWPGPGDLAHLPGGAA